MTNIVFGRDVRDITRLIAREMPALEFVIWDLTPFIPNLHNWRKNIVFIECDRVAVEPLAERLTGKYPEHEVYVGVNKPILKIGRSDKTASLVIVARTGKKRREVSGRNPKIEKCLVDLLYYAINEVLPISLNDILDLWEYYLTDTNQVKFSELYRYSIRRYLGWFVSIFAYELSKKAKLNADARHYKTGQKNVELVQMVTKREERL